MPQMRFQIGVPKAGSAARTAESGERMESVRPRAGSAARQAEEQRRLEGPWQGAKAATLRVQSGPRRETAAVASSAMQADVLAVHSPAPAKLADKFTDAPAASLLAGDQLPSQTQPEAHSLLETVAGRFRTLVESFLSSKP